VRREIPGMAPTRSWIDTMFCSVRSPALKAVIAIGVAWTVDSRFSAVTMISSNPAFSAGVLPAGAAIAEPLRVTALNSPETSDARILSRASVAHNPYFMSESPYVKQKQLRDVDCDGPARLNWSSPSVYWRSHGDRETPIRNIAFTDTQVYCTTGTRKIAFAVAEMPQGEGRGDV
jgi:hypothetical protein